MKYIKSNTRDVRQRSLDAEKESVVLTEICSFVFAMIERLQSSSAVERTQWELTTVHTLVRDALRFRDEIFQRKTNKLLTDELRILFLTKMEVWPGKTYPSLPYNNLGSCTHPTLDLHQIGSDVEDVMKGRKMYDVVGWSESDHRQPVGRTSGRMYRNSGEAQDAAVPTGSNKGTINHKQTKDDYIKLTIHERIKRIYKVCRVKGLYMDAFSDILYKNESKNRVADCKVVGSIGGVDKDSRRTVVHLSYEGLSSSFTTIVFNENAISQVKS